MKWSRIPVIITLLLVLPMGGCSKYEEGPAISLRSRKERVANTWALDKAIYDGGDITPQFKFYELKLTEDGGATLNYEFLVIDTVSKAETSGTWSFKNDDEYIYFDYGDSTQDGEFHILKLREKEMWLEKTGNHFELHLKEK